MQAEPARALDAQDALGGEASTIFEIFERLGLRLERQNAPVEMFVIEHIETLAVK